MVNRFEGFFERTKENCLCTYNYYYKFCLVILPNDLLLVLNIIHQDIEIMSKTLLKSAKVELNK